MSQTSSRTRVARRHFPFSGWDISLLSLLVGAALFWVPGAPAQTDSPFDQQAVPATFLRELLIPGHGDTILRPSVVHHDEKHGEMLVADTGNNRIVVFNDQGTYRFEFPLGDLLGSIRDLTTDAEGYYYILGSVPGRRAVHRFDFDGLPLGEIPLPTELDGVPLQPRSLACADGDRLLLLDEAGLRICEFDLRGRILATHPLAPGLGDAVRAEIGCGPLTVIDRTILVPVSTLGTVLRFGLDGRFQGNVGIPGNLTGTLNFPVAVEGGPDGMLLVIDKHRYCVVAYDADGKFLGEFGGKGYRLGWFFHPTLLAVPGPDRVVVGQIFQNRIQVCALPTFIREGAARGAESRAAREGNPVPFAVAGSDPDDTMQRRSVESPVPLTLKDEIGFSPSTTHVSHLEVSE